MGSRPARALRSLLRRSPLRPGGRLLLVLLPALLLFGCAREGFQLTVTFPGPLDIEEGALVRYQGIPVGGITGIALSQGSPSQPGLVELSVVIDQSDIVLREDDVFEITSDGLLGEPYLRVTPAPESSPPLAAGARVAGRPPLVKRVVETTEEALARLGVLAREQADLLVERLEEQFEGRELSREDLGIPEPGGASAGKDGGGGPPEASP